RLPELLAVVDIRHDRVHHRDHDAGRSAREHRSFVVEAAHQHSYATVQLAENVLFRYFDVFEHQLTRMRATHAELVELLRNRKTLHALLDDKRRNAARIRLRVGLRIDYERVAIGAVGDPHLRAVEHITVAPLLGA